MGNGLCVRGSALVARLLSAPHYPGDLLIYNQHTICIKWLDKNRLALYACAAGNTEVTSGRFGHVSEIEEPSQSVAKSVSGSPDALQESRGNRL